MVKTTGYFFAGSKGTGFTIDASILTPSDVGKLDGRAGLYVGDASQVVVAELASIVRSLPFAVDQSSTCLGCDTDDQVSMKYCAFGDMSIVWRPGVVVIRFKPDPSNFTCQSCRSSGDGFVDVK